MWWEELLSPSRLPLMIPIVAILVGGIIGLVWLIFCHRERMAMIERGIHPDHPPEEEDPEPDAAASPEAIERSGAYDKRGAATSP